MERRHSLGAAEAVPFGIRFEPPRDNSRIVGCSSPIRSTYGVPVIRQVGRKFRDNLVSLPMCVVAPEMSAAQVLSAFHRDAPYLFLGAAFVAVGMVSAAFSALRRKQDPLLLYFALYAVLYGIRLWIQAELLEISIHESWFYPRLRSGINYIVPIPAILFFNAAGLLRGAGKIAGNILIIASSVLPTAPLLLGPASIYDRFNSVVVIAAMIAFVAQFTRSEAASADYRNHSSRSADFCGLRRVGQPQRRLPVLPSQPGAIRLCRISGFSGIRRGPPHPATRSAAQRDSEGTGGGPPHPTLDFARGVPGFAPLPSLRTLPAYDFGSWRFL